MERDQDQKNFIPQLLWQDWQSQMLSWWPTLFNKYKLSLSGRYVTALPAIFFSITVLIVKLFLRSIVCFNSLVVLLNSMSLMVSLQLPENEI